MVGKHFHTLKREEPGGARNRRSDVLPATHGDPAKTFFCGAWPWCAWDDLIVFDGGVSDCKSGIGGLH